MFRGDVVLLFGMPGPLELVVILIIVLLVVGPKKLPELMKAVGKSLSSFRKGMREGELEDTPRQKEIPSDPSDEKKS